MTDEQKLRESLHEGDFVQATALVKRKGLDRKLGRLPTKTPRRMAAAAAVAEVLFYVGRNEEARRVIVAAAPRERWLERIDAVPARGRLQLAEHDYSLRDFPLAKSTAIRIRNQCKDVDDYLGAAEASYYLARCVMRQHRTTEVFEACRDALEYLAAAQAAAPTTRPAGGDLTALQWRMGLILLVSGFAASKTDQSSAWADLYGARALLANTRDTVGKANVDATIGAALRSRSTPQDMTKALAAFKTALAVYTDTDHPLNIARVRTHLGRTLMNLERWSEAKAELDLAMQAADRIGDRPLRRRQRAECLVWTAWWHRATDKHDVINAMSYAGHAFEELDELHRETATSPGEISVEAGIVLGECQQAAGEYETARETLKVALSTATGRSIPKLAINAHLALATVEVSSGHVGEAIVHYRHAIKMLTKDSSAFLRKKAQRLKDQIEATSAEAWLMTENQLLRPGGLVQAMASLEKWGVARVEAKYADRPLRDKAHTVGLKSGPGYLKLLRRVGGGQIAKVELPPVPGMV
jgi:tetratricopeptide (TPR) repeat protein